MSSNSSGSMLTEWQTAVYDHDVTSFDDEAALIRAAQLNHADFGRIYDRYVTRIYSYLLRQSHDAILAEDLTSLTFEKALKKLDHYEDRGKSFCAWLYTIARNELNSHYRRQKWWQPWKRDIEDRPSGINVELLVQKSERATHIYHAINQLSESDRDLITLRFLEGLPTKDVASMLGVKSQVVYVRLNRALGRLRSVLEAENYE